MAESSFKIHIDSSEIDIALEKAQKLTELLGEAQEIVKSMSGLQVYRVDEFTDGLELSMERMFNELARGGDK